MSITAIVFASSADQAKAIGYDLGVSGKPQDMPDSVDRRFRLAYAEGWHKGNADRQMRDAMLEECDMQEWAKWYEANEAKVRGAFDPDPIGEMGGCNCCTCKMRSQIDG